jgi:hypothetical protein
MAEEKPTIHVDSDWKRQAQEEKRRLAEEEQKRKQQETLSAASVPPVVPTTGPAAPSAEARPRTAGGRRPAGREAREIPPASFATLVQSMLTQTLFYLGELATREGTMVDLDMARHHIDTMAVLEEKTRGNLTAEEKALLDTALYEARMRFVSLASQVASSP